MRLQNIFKNNYQRKLYESLEEFKSDNNDPVVVHNHVNKILNTLTEKYKHSKPLPKLLNEHHANGDSIYILWESEGKGLPKGFGTEQSNEEFNQWLKELIQLNEDQSFEMVERLFESSQRFKEMFNFIYAIDEYYNSLEDGSEEKQILDDFMDDSTNASFEELKSYSNQYIEMINNKLQVNNPNLKALLVNMTKYMIIKNQFLTNNMMKILPEKLNKKIMKQFRHVKEYIMGMDHAGGISFVTDLSDINKALKNIIEKLNHYFSLDYEPIKRYDVSKKPLDQILNELSDLEQEWIKKKEEESQWIELEEDDEIVIDYGKWAWVKLPRGICQKEGDAMLHCGNADGSDTDRIISYRKKSKSNPNIMKPHLTFILDKNGFLGQMKGPSNEKPHERHHGAIIDLLKKDFVKGIKGGGYDPENNFQIEDLSDEVRNELVEGKPLLDPVKSYKSVVEENGSVTREHLILLSDYIEENGYNDAGEMTLLVQNGDKVYLNIDPLADFVNDDATQIIDLSQGNTNFETQLGDNIDDENYSDLLDVIKNRQSESYNVLLSYLKETFSLIENTNTYEEYEEIFDNDNTKIGELFEFLSKEDSENIEVANDDDNNSLDNKFIKRLEKIEEVIEELNAIIRFSIQRSIESKGLEKLRDDIYDEIKHYAYFQENINEDMSRMMSEVEENYEITIPIKDLEYVIKEIDDGDARELFDVQISLDLDQDFDENDFEKQDDLIEDTAVLFNSLKPKEEQEENE